MERRTFLLSTPVFALQAPETLTAMIGIGRRGSALEKQVLRTPGAKIVAVSDTDSEARDRAASMAARDNPKGYDDYRRVLDLKEVQAVIIASPCDLHAEMAAAALEAGKYVYCEKPIGITVQQVQRVLTAARRSKTFLQIGQQLRYRPGFREVVSVLKNVLGDVYLIRAQRNSSPLSPEAERDRPAWYLDVKRSGDLIVENAVHNLDVCNWITGSRPESAYGFGKKYKPKPIPAGTQMMDGFMVEYIYSNDVSLEYAQIYLHPRTLKDLPSGQWYFVYGDKGVVDIAKALFYPHSGEAPSPVVDPERLQVEENAMVDFYACIRENRVPEADVKVGATAALTAIMGREAIYKRRMVTWKELGVDI